MKTPKKVPTPSVKKSLKTAHQIASQDIEGTTTDSTLSTLRSQMKSCGAELPWGSPVDLDWISRGSPADLPWISWASAPVHDLVGVRVAGRATGEGRVAHQGLKVNQGVAHVVGLLGTCWEPPGDLLGTCWGHLLGYRSGEQLKSACT